MDEENTPIDNEHDNTLSPPVQKKRGRKPKVVDPNTIDEKQKKKDKEKDRENENNSEEEDGEMKTKRRGRKPKDKFKCENTDYEEFQKNIKKEDNVIIKLPLSCLKLNEEFNIGKDLFSYNPKITTPKPYNPEDLNHKLNINYASVDGTEIIDDVDENIDNDNLENNFNNSNFNNTFHNNFNNNLNNNFNKILNTSTEKNNKTQLCDKCNQKTTNENVRQIDIILTNKYNSNTDKFNVLTHLGIGLNNNKWIEKSEVPCLWCCHSFKTTPWGIPYKFFNGVFQLFGNFCLPNCALAYLLKFYKDDDSQWEKIALLNLLYFKVHGQYKTLVPSFDKMSTKMFGGTLEIDDYRNIVSQNDKSYSLEFPPCNTIIPMLEEIYKKTQLTNTFIPVDKTRINIANNELKLKRSKPIIDHKNTLDFCLGITGSSNGNNN